MQELDVQNRQTMLQTVCIFCVVLQAAWFYPGFVYYDSFDQYSQAVAGRYSDWHPPIMAVFWRVQMQLLGTADAFYLIHIIAFWLAVYIVVRNCGVGQWRVLLAVLFGFSPFVLPYLGVVWKDVSLAVSALLACALIIDARINGVKDGMFRGVAIALLLTYASLVRTNGPFLTAPIILLALGGPRGINIWWALKSAALCAGLVLLSPIVNNVIIGAEKTGPIIQLQIFDIGGISHFSKKNLFPGAWTLAEDKNITELCYDANGWAVYAAGSCDFVLQKVDRPAISASWMGAIASHPIAYIIHRLSHFNSLLRFIGYHDAYFYYVDNVPGYQNVSHPAPAPVYRAFVGFMAAHPGQIWHKPYFWLLGALSLFLATIGSECRIRQAVNVMAFSSLFYLAGYLLFGVGPDFRFALPAAVLVTLAAIVEVSTRFAPDGKAAGDPLKPFCGSSSAAGDWNDHIS